MTLLELFIDNDKNEMTVMTTTVMMVQLPVEKPVLVQGQTEPVTVEPVARKTKRGRRRDKEKEKAKKKAKKKNTETAMMTLNHHQISQQLLPPLSILLSRAKLNWKGFKWMKIHWDHWARPICARH